MAVYSNPSLPKCLPRAHETPESSLPERTSPDRVRESTFRLQMVSDLASLEGRRDLGEKENAKQLEAADSVKAKKQRKSVHRWESFNECMSWLFGKFPLFREHEVPKENCPLSQLVPQQYLKQDDAFPKNGHDKKELLCDIISGWQSIPVPLDSTPPWNGTSGSNLSASYALYEANHPTENPSPGNLTQPSVSSQMNQSSCEPKEKRWNEAFAETDSKNGHLKTENPKENNQQLAVKPSDGKQIEIELSYCDLTQFVKAPASTNAKEQLLWQRQRRLERLLERRLERLERLDDSRARSAAPTPIPTPSPHSSSVRVMDTRRRRLRGAERVLGGARPREHHKRDLSIFI